MRRAERLYRITDHLRSRRLTTAAWLASRLDVSARTIYRDIADLVAAGVPITGEAGVGYSLQRRIDLPPLLFDRAELAALAVGVRFVRAYGDPMLARGASGAFAKIRAALPRHALETEAAPAVFVPRKRGLALDPVRHITAAIESRSRVSLAYRDEHGAGTTRTVWPLGLLFGGSSWTLVAWCELRDGFRSFRTDRIERAIVLEETFPDQPGRRLEDFWREMHLVHGVPESDFDPER
jgi:predicted DNA-binding transcriptional regulator YafY